MFKQLHQKCSTMYSNVFSGLYFSRTQGFQFSTVKILHDTFCPVSKHTELQDLHRDTMIQGKTTLTTAHTQKQCQNHAYNCPCLQICFNLGYSRYLI